MKPSITLARPFGIPVGLHWTAIVVAALATWSLTGLFGAVVPGYPTGTYWVTSLLTVALFLGGLVAHELGHAVVAKRYGLEVRRITLWALGGVAELGHQPRTPKVELLVAAAGPLVSIVVSVLLAGVALAAGAATDAGVLVTALWWLAAVNVVVAVFNLLPARPLDGGRILTAVLWWRSGDQLRATVTATKAAGVVAAGLAGLGVWQLLAGGFGGLWMLLVAWFVLSSARAERVVAELRAAVEGVTAGQAMSAPPPSVAPWVSVSELVAEHARQSAARVWLVERIGAGPIGALAVDRAARLAMTRPQLTVGEAAEPVDPAAVVSPRDDLGRVLAERAIVLPFVVVERDAVVGQVTLDDLRRAALVGPRPSGRPLPPPIGAPLYTDPVPVGSARSGR